MATYVHKKASHLYRQEAKENRTRKEISIYNNPIRKTLLKAGYPAPVAAWFEDIGLRYALLFSLCGLENVPILTGNNRETLSHIGAQTVRRSSKASDHKRAMLLSIAKEKNVPLPSPMEAYNHFKKHLS